MLDAEVVNRIAGTAPAVASPISAETAAEFTTAVATHMTFADERQELWERLMFYEEIAQRPPLLLRWLLPRPLRVEGRKLQVGDVATCIYESGYLLKRVTHVDEPRQYEFEIAEQALKLGGGLRLTGGRYNLTSLPSGGTRVELTTRYCGGRRPRWLARPIEAAVCHAFHRYVLRSIRSALATTRVQPEPERAE